MARLAVPPSSACSPNYLLVSLPSMYQCKRKTCKRAGRTQKHAKCRSSRMLLSLDVAVQAVHYLDGCFCCLLHICGQPLAPGSLAGELHHLVVLLVLLGVHELMGDAANTSTCSMHDLHQT